jgi:hypothetical protein
MTESERFHIHPNMEVTTLSYHYWNERDSECEFKKLEYALNETWRFCGLLKGVIVVNRVDPWVEKFAEAHRNIDLQVEESLKVGSLWSLSLDSIVNMYKRFNSNYVLTVQTDGYPLREGLNDFVGKWDFIGAPHICDVWWKRLASDVLQFRPMNGGFSLRSRECCEQVSYWWNKKYSHLGDCKVTIEDWFYTAYLPAKEKSYKRAMKFPDVASAVDFSYEAISPYKRSRLPFGFHRMHARNVLTSIGLLRDSETAF